MYRNAMTTAELIRKYKIVLMDHNTPYGKPALRIYNDRDAIKDGAVQEIKARKAEIIAYFAAEREAAANAHYHRLAKINAIEGLKEITAAEREIAAWHAEFNRQANTEDGVLCMPEYPKYDLKAMYAQYPHAAAYIKAREYAEKENDELAAIGRKALDAVIDGDYTTAMAAMDADIEKFTDAHMWD